MALVAAGFVAPIAASAATVSVRITDRLSPAELTVPAGATIRFVNADNERHRMRSQSGPAEFDSHNLEPGQSYSMKLTAKGTYTYLDERDDENARYFGRIVVGASAAGGGPLNGTATGFVGLGLDGGPCVQPVDDHDRGRWLGHVPQR